MKHTIILTIVIILFTCVTLYARELITNDGTMQNFAKVIRIKGYACDKCVSAYFYGKKHRGKEFRIICDEERNAFRVTVTSADFIVEPW